MTNPPQIIENAEDKPSPLSVFSPKQIQAFYNEMTGRKESMTRYYDDLIIAELTDIENLHHKIYQTADQYDVIAREENVRIYFDNDQKEVFSSYQQFSLRSQAEGRKTEAIILSYNFLIKLPGVEKTQEYQINVRLASNIVLVKQMQKQIPAHLWNLVSYKNNRVDIEFVDYSVARSFSATVHEWFDSLTKHEPNRVFAYLRSKADTFPFIFQVVFVVASAIYLSSFSQRLLQEGAENLSTIVSLLIIAGSTIFVLSLLGSKFGQVLKSGFFAHVYPSYISLSKGDERAICELSHANAKNKLWSVIKLVLNGLVSFGCSIAANILSV